MIMRTLVKEPLFHFLVLGLIFYGLAGILAPAGLETESPMEIHITKDKLTEYLQFQQKSFRPEQAEAVLRVMSHSDRELLIDNYVRDEALYREAIALGLDNNDEIIRRRLIQKMEYIAQGFYNELPAIDETALQRYFIENQQQYRVEPSITFTHVFISNSNHDESPASDSLSKTDLVSGTLAELKQLAVPFEDAGRYGDRFLYNLNYVERTPAYIANHFGKHFSEAVFDMSVSSEWQGPLKSEYGAHLVLIKDKSVSRIPDLEEVADLVLADTQREQQRETRLAAIKTLVDKYSVTDSIDEFPTEH